MITEGVSDKVETDPRSCKVEERSSVTIPEPQVGGNLESTGLKLNSDFEHKHFGSDSVLGEKTYQPGRKSAEEPIAADGTEESVDNDESIATNIKPACGAYTSAEDQVKSASSHKVGDLDMGGQNNAFLSHGGLTADITRDSITSSDASKSHISTLQHMTSSHFHPQSTLTSTSMELPAQETSASSEMLLQEKQPSKNSSLLQELLNE